MFIHLITKDRNTSCTLQEPLESTQVSSRNGKRPLMDDTMLLFEKCLSKSTPKTQRYNRTAN